MWGAKRKTKGAEAAGPAKDGSSLCNDASLGEAAGFDGQVVLVHGDTHFFKVDKPLLGPKSLLPNITRVRTFGETNVHWVRATIDPRSRNVFSFEPMIVPGN